MKKEINESLKFLLAEYRRLKIKDKNNTINKEEKETLRKITVFLSKENE